MERFSERESVLLGYNNPPRPLMSFNSVSSKTAMPFRNSDVDFHDVFGGPPRRFSMQELRPDFKLSDDDDDSEGEPWHGGGDKPVFGDDGGSRRRLPSADFFKDIFGGDSPVNSNQKRHNHVFPGSPGSRVLTPLPPKAEPFGASSPLAQFSLPAKVTKALNRSTEKTEESPNKTSPKKESEGLVTSTNHNGHFHFSIYKWGSKGVPLDMPLRRKNGSSRLKDGVKPELIFERDQHADKNSNSTSNNHDSKTSMFDSSSNDQTVPNNFPSPLYENNTKARNGLPRDEVAEEKKIQSAVKDEPEAKVISVCEEETRKTEVKSVHSLFYDDFERGFDEKKIVDKNIKGLSSPTVGYTKTTKKQDRKNASEVEKVNGIPFSPRRENNGKSRVKGRVREFVKIFNQDSSPKIARDKDGLMSRSKSCKWTEKTAFEDHEKTDSPREEEKLYKPTKANEDLKQSAKVHASEHETSLPSSGSLSDVSKATAEESDECFHDNFQVKELIQNENGQLESVTHKEFQEIDAKIRQWTKGKEGNIRSLLSTLQFVLWFESGWKPIPLVDIIEGNAVKRAYQRALLCLHPDKLQQKGASSHQRYLAEKVFDILQDAWNYFNSLGAV